MAVMFVHQHRGQTQRQRKWWWAAPASWRKGSCGSIACCTSPSGPESSWRSERQSARCHDWKLPGSWDLLIVLLSVRGHKMTLPLRHGVTYVLGPVTFLPGCLLCKFVTMLSRARGRGRYAYKRACTLRTDTHIQTGICTHAYTNVHTHVLEHTHTQQDRLQK